MKSSILIASYLWKDTWKHWLEQPGSPLARMWVTMLLAAVAAVILTSFDLLERSLRERLDSFGLNTLLVRETLAPDTRYLFLNDEGPDLLSTLNTSGTRLRVRQLFARALSEWQSELPVVTYPPSALPLLSRYLSHDTPLLCLSDRLPSGAFVQITLNRQSALAYVLKPDGWLRFLANNDLLLAPQGIFPEEERMGGIEVTLYQRATNSPPMARIVAAIEALYANDNRPLPQIQSPLSLLRDWELLKKRQAQWRTILAAILGGVLALVYGAIAVLEFRQSLYTNALLRSFGAPRLFLYARYWLENALLANASALAGVLIVVAFHPTLFANLGLSSAPLTRAGSYLSPEALLVFLWVNFGVFLSSLPTVVALRQPIGTTLS